MQPQLHVANTFFESELEHPWTGKGDLQTALAHLFQCNPIFLQLQFLPFLYAQEGDAVLVSHLPNQEYEAVRKQYGLPNLELIHLNIPRLIKNFQLVPWGHSQLLAQWAAVHGVAYTIPSWSVVQEVNSKAFSFQNAPKLPQAELLLDSKDAEHWFNNTAGKRVLKTCYGVSGRGHFHVGSNPSLQHKQITAFLEKQWQQGHPVIAEPWVDRVLDFSTQWMVTREKEIAFLGTTSCHNTPTGQYRSNLVGDEATLLGPHLVYLTEHKNIAKKVLGKMADMGYFGPVGIDALLYRHPDTQQITLHHIVEINARRTMGWVAITFQQTHYPRDCIEFTLAPETQGLLPSSAIAPSGNPIFFKHNVQVRIVSPNY